MKPAGVRDTRGVALFVNHRFDCTLRTAKYFEMENIFECVTIESGMQKRKNIIVSCVYRTPGSDIDIFCEHMDQLLTYANPSKTKFVCGDFNIDLLKQETHTRTKLFLECMYGQGLYPLILRLSRITINSCTLIDNIFTNQINYSADSGLVITDISDHLPIFVLCKCELKKKNSKTFRNVRSLKEDNARMFMESFKQEQWESVLHSDDVNIAYVINTFNTLYNLYCPVKKVKIKDTCRKILGCPTA